MTLSEKDRDILLRYKNVPDEDNVRYKQIIKEKLLTNNRIIYLLNNQELEDAESENDEYFGVNILPYYFISPTQTRGMNYICFETQTSELSRNNALIKIQQIIFYILVEKSNIIEPLTSVARHDLIAAELINMFQGCNDFGNQLKLTSFKPSVTDTDYPTITLVFDQLTPNSPTQYGKQFNLRK